MDLKTVEDGPHNEDLWLAALGPLNVCPSWRSHDLGELRVGRLGRYYLRRRTF